MSVSGLIGEKEKIEVSEEDRNLQKLRDITSIKLEETLSRDWGNPTRAAMEDALAIAEIRSELDFLIRQKRCNTSSNKDNELIN